MYDSVDKIITSYFSCLSPKEFTYKKKVYTPRTLSVSPMIFRGMTCPAGCGGCCSKTSLDFLPHEELPPGFEHQFAEREITFDGRPVYVRSDVQHLDRSREEEKKCRHLNLTDGRCGIHTNHPFSCDFELIRFMVMGDKTDLPNRVTTRLFGRGWNMMRIDGERGAKCEALPVDSKTVADVIRKLKRLREWVLHFGINTWRLDLMISWAESGPHPDKLDIPVSKEML